MCQEAFREGGPSGPACSRGCRLQRICACASPGGGYPAPGRARPGTAASLPSAACPALFLPLQTPAGTTHCGCYDCNLLGGFGWRIMQASLPLSLSLSQPCGSLGLSIQSPLSAKCHLGLPAPRRWHDSPCPILFFLFKLFANVPIAQGYPCGSWRPPCLPSGLGKAGQAWRGGG